MYTRKNVALEIPEEDTKIWMCGREGCNIWMRDNFAFDTVPNCQVCHTPMVSSMKMLPVLVNPNIDVKALKKGVQIQ